MKSKHIVKIGQVYQHNKMTSERVIVVYVTYTTIHPIPPQIVCMIRHGTI